MKCEKCGGDMTEVNGTGEIPEGFKVGFCEACDEPENLFKTEVDI